MKQPPRKNRLNGGKLIKVNGRAAVILLAMVAIFIIGMDFRVEASQYLGQVTWTWHKTMDETGPTDKTETITAGIFFIGGSYYELVGGGFDADSGTEYGGGSAMLVGNNLIITVSRSKVRLDGRQETGIFHFQVDKTTFNGTGWGIKKRLDPIPESPTYRTFTDKYAAGTLTIVGNPPPLGPTTMAPMQLLLLDGK
ncbi:MAG: hypothetical protein ABIG94_01740 [Pseudomonadota bacterium]